MSALHQVHVEVNVIVVDDGSQDGTADALSALDERRMTVIRNESPLGVSAARNLGIAHAATSLVAFLDDDDLWAPTKLAEQVDAMAKAGDAEWSTCGSVRVNAFHKVIGGQHAPPSGPVGPQLLHADVIPGGGSSVLARRQLVEDLGGFDTAFSCIEDWDLWIRMGQVSPVASVDRPLVANVVHSRNFSLDPTPCLAELPLLARKLEERGLVLRPGATHLWIADGYFRSGRRRRGALALARAVRNGQRPPLSLLVLGPSRRLMTLWDQMTLDRMGDEWRAEAEAWLQAS